MHGLQNDPILFSGRIVGDTTAPYVISELALLTPIAVTACLVLILAGRGLGLDTPPRLRTKTALAPSHIVDR